MANVNVSEETGLALASTETQGSSMTPAFPYLEIRDYQAISQSRPAIRNSTKQQKWLRRHFRALRFRYLTSRPSIAFSKLRRRGVSFVTGLVTWVCNIVSSSFQRVLCLV